MDPETRLAALWAETNPPARDLNFAVAVMARVERARIWRQVFNLVPLMVVVGVLAWALAPAVETALAAGIADVNQLATTGVLMALSIILGIWLAMGGFRGALA